MTHFRLAPKSILCQSAATSHSEKHSSTNLCLGGSAPYASVDSFLVAIRHFT